MDAQFSYIQAIPSSEKMTIYDIVFNHYGNRMAVSSSDQLITVWNKVSDWKEWEKTAEWKAHENPALKITWVHPEFGQALASCSTDRSVAIWEEMLDDNYKVEVSWIRKATLMGSNTAITDIKFAPKTLDLLLAISSTDGIIRIFKALDALNLSQWSLQQEVSYTHRTGCLAWNPNGTSNNFAIKYYKVDELNNDVGSIYSLYPRVVDEPNVYIVLNQEPMLAVGFDDEHCKIEDKIKILLYSSRYQRWNKTELSIKDKRMSDISGPICDMAFAARLGRVYDLLAVADKNIKMYALYKAFDQSQSTFKFQFCFIYSFPCHYSSIRKISWNSVGNILISSGDDGCIKLWKQYKYLIDVEEKNTSRQKSANQKKHLQYCWKCKIIEI